MLTALSDATGLVLASLIAVFVIYLPGACIARLARSGLPGGSAEWPASTASLLCAFAFLPLLYCLVIRWVGVEAALLLAGLLALAGAALTFRDLSAPSPAAAAAALLWLAVVAWSFVDIEIGGSLYQSLLVLDLVKHAATIRQIADHGLPLVDPFFARETPSGCYYYFYSLPALIVRAGAGAVDPRMAFAATAFWTGFGLLALLVQVARAAGLAGAEQKGFGRIMLAVAVVGSLDILFMVILSVNMGVTQPQANWWNEEVTGWIQSALWVPHHALSFVAIWVGLLALLARRPSAQPRAFDRRAALLAGAAFATSFGASFWVAFSAALVILGWLLSMFRGRDWHGFRTLAAAGAIALFLSAGLLFEMVQGRSVEAFPIALTVRRFALIHPEAGPSAAILLLALLPLSYLVAFGLLALGSLVYWAGRRQEGRALTEMERLLVLGAIISLLIGSFLKSTVINNDLGWRALLFAQLAATVWTASILATRPRFRLSPAAVTFIALGLATTVYNIAGSRIVRAPRFSYPYAFVNQAPEVDASVRQAYLWAGKALPADAVLQHNPASTMRVFGFGLYGRQRPAVADGEAMLFGAAREEVAERVGTLAPVFNSPAPIHAVAAAAAENGVQHIIVDRRDPIWRRPDAPLWKLRQEYCRDGVAILAVAPAPPNAPTSACPLRSSKVRPPHRS